MSVGIFKSGHQQVSPAVDLHTCGICRQVMREFCDDSFQVIVVRSVEDRREYCLDEILPFGFGGQVSPAVDLHIPNNPGNIAVPTDPQLILPRHISDSVILPLQAEWKGLSRRIMLIPAASAAR